MAGFSIKVMLSLSIMVLFIGACDSKPETPAVEGDNLKVADYKTGVVMMKAIVTACEQFNMDKGCYPTKFTELGDYLDDVP